MAFEWDNLHERTWLRWYRGREDRIETKRRVAGGALHVDAAVRGPIDGPPGLDFVPAGLSAIENRAPGSAVGASDIFGLAGRLCLLLQREHEESRPLDPRLAAAVLLAGRGTQDLLEQIRFETVRAGVRRTLDLSPPVYLVAADELDREVKNAFLILYHGSDEAVDALVQDVHPDLYKDILERALVIRRVRLRQALEKRGIDMSEVKLDIRGAILDIGLRKVIEGVGVKEVIEEIGLKQVIEEVGLQQVIEEVGLQRVIQEIGADRLRSELEKYERKSNGE
ncbi:MAG: hypothetical protein HY720_15285 [Planctomycetes bacterium]|nr:hypothetical protein [Planctomycetota bacterium]